MKITELQKIVAHCKTADAFEDALEEDVNVDLWTVEHDPDGCRSCDWEPWKCQLALAAVVAIERL